MLPCNDIDLFSAYMQEGLAIKAERMKKKITGGKKKVEIDEIKVTIHPRIISYDWEEKTRWTTSEQTTMWRRVSLLDSPLTGGQKTKKRVKTFDSEDPVEELDAVSVAPTEATEVDEEEENIAGDADQPNDVLEEAENEEVEEPENNEEDENDEEAAEDMDENGLGDAEDDDMD